MADKVVDEIVCEEMETLEKIIPRMFEVMEKVAKFSCDYVKRGSFGGHLLLFNLTGAECRENSRWAGQLRKDRRNG